MEALTEAGLKKEDIDMLVPHQANLRISQFVQRRLVHAGQNRYRNQQRPVSILAEHNRFPRRRGALRQSLLRFLRAVPRLRPRLPLLLQRLLHLFQSTVDRVPRQIGRASCRERV